MELIFEWDDEKNLKNQRKHHVSFAVAKKVFYDEHRIDAADDTHSGQEERRITIGMARKILFVVYTERDYDDHDAIRIISARRANEEERMMYYEQYYS